MTTFILNLDPLCRLSDEQFYQLALANPDIKLERRARSLCIGHCPSHPSWDRNKEGDAYVDPTHT